MKKIFFPLMGMLLAFSFTGKNDLPASITAILHAKYPDFRIKGWEIVNDKYKVKFTTDRNKEISYFSADGKWLRTERHFGLMKDLPAAVRRGFAKSGYAAWKVDNIHEVWTPAQSEQYVLHVENGNELDAWHYDAFKKDMLLIFDRDGGLLDQQKA